MLEEYPDIYVVAEADDGQSLVDKFIEFKPDIVLTMDERQCILDYYENERNGSRKKNLRY